MKMKPIQSMTPQELDREIIHRLSLLTDSEKESIIVLLSKLATAPAASASAHP